MPGDRGKGVLRDRTLRDHSANLRAFIEAPAGTFADVVNQMLAISASIGDPPIYRTFIRGRFVSREVIVPPTPLTAMTDGRINYSDPGFVDGEDLTQMRASSIPATLRAPQDRSTCCGTMQLPEFIVANEKLVESAVPLSDDRLLEREVAALAEAFK